MDATAIKHNEVVIESRLWDRAVRVRRVAELNPKAKLLQCCILEETTVPSLSDSSTPQER